MGESNGDWGSLAVDDDLADAWDGFQRLPEPGENPALDAFVERQHISIAALVRLGTRLADYEVIAFAFPGGIKFRHLVIKNKRWSQPGSVFKALKIVQHGPEPSSSVIVAEGESDAAWLSTRASCDVAVLPAGADARPHVAAYAAQLAGYELVLLGHDNDEAGHAGAAQLAELLPQAVRFMPPAKDWCLSDELPPLPEPSPSAKDALVGGIVFADLAQVLADGIPEPKVLVDDLLYEEGVHWLQGHPGAGKTTVAMSLAIDVMLENRHVVWLDYEGGLPSTVRRLLACDCDLGLAVAQFHYAAWPNKAGDSLQAIAERWPGAMVVFDSASKVLQNEGLDENSPKEVTEWASVLVRACKTFHLPVIVIDHVTKSATRDTKYARGAGSKLADSDVAWFVDTVSPFSRSQAGVIMLQQQKDREGCLPYQQWFKIGDGGGKLPLTRMDNPELDSDAEDEPAI